MHHDDSEPDSIAVSSDDRASRDTRGVPVLPYPVLTRDSAGSQGRRAGAGRGGGASGGADGHDRRASDAPERGPAQPRSGSAT
eukprot:2242992-Rhodomonas_salina.2